VIAAVVQVPPVPTVAVVMVAPDAFLRVMRAHAVPVPVNMTLLEVVPHTSVVFDTGAMTGAT
jgi:hypothetical protein